MQQPLYYCHKKILKSLLLPDTILITFYDMVQELSLLINVPQEKLLEEYKAIHQEVGSVEYPFATLNLPSVKKKYCGISDEQVKIELNPAFHKFNSTRKKLV